MMQFSEFAARRSSKAVKPPSLVEPTMVASLKGTAVSIDFFLPLLSHSSTLKLQLHFHCDIALFWGSFIKYTTTRKQQLAVLFDERALEHPHC